MSVQSKLFVQIILFLILPVLILYNVSQELKGIIAIGLLIEIIVITALTRISLKDQGIRLDNSKAAFFPYVIWTLLGIIMLVIFAKLTHKQPLQQWWTYDHLQWFFLPVSFLQEYVYRSLFQSRLQKVVNPIVAIVVIAFAYSFLHILWNDLFLLGITFLGGLIWGYIWFKYPNLLYMTLSHAIINFLAVYLGFFPWLVTQYFYLH